MLILLLIPITCTFTFTFGMAYFYTRQKYLENNNLPLPLNATNTIIVFDLHGVLFNHDYKKMAATFWASPKKWKFMGDMLDPCLIRDVLILLYRRPIPESFFMHLAHKYKAVKDELPLLIRIANCQKINRPMIKLVRKLKAEGYQLHLLVK